GRVYLLFIFFFSSRRRHTRSKRDWSSDVCSSDLQRTGSCALLWDDERVMFPTNRGCPTRSHGPCHRPWCLGGSLEERLGCYEVRSEERRVGRESGRRRAR